MISKASLLQKERTISREDNQPIKLHLNTLYCMWLTETLLTEAIWFWFWQCTLCIQWRGNAYTKCMVSLFPAPFTVRTSEACHRPMTHRRYRPGHGRRFFFLQTRIAIPQYFSQSYGAYFKHIVRTCAYTSCKCLRDVNDILRHIKIRAI